MTTLVAAAHVGHCGGSDRSGGSWQDAARTAVKSAPRVRVLDVRALLIPAAPSDLGRAALVVASIAPTRDSMGSIWIAGQYKRGPKMGGGVRTVIVTASGDCCEELRRASSLCTLASLDAARQICGQRQEVRGRSSRSQAFASRRASAFGIAPGCPGGGPVGWRRTVASGGPSRCRPLSRATGRRSAPRHQERLGKPHESLTAGIAAQCRLARRERDQLGLQLPASLDLADREPAVVGRLLVQHLLQRVGQVGLGQDHGRAPGVASSITP